MDSDYIISKYLRISDDDGRYGDSQSIEGQRAILDDYIASDSNLKTAKILEFVDDGWSGTNFNRPGVKEMLAKVKTGGIHCILVKDFSRFGRSYIDVGDYLEQIFPFLRVRFISVNDHFDSNRQECSAGDVGVAFKSLCNDYYSKDLSRKVRAGFAAMWGDGKIHAGFTPYGYKKAEQNKYLLVPDDETAPVVRRIFNMKLAGVSTKEIAMTLNNEETPTPAERKAEKYGWNLSSRTDFLWTPNTIRLILQDIRYTGCLTQGMSRCEVVGGRKYRKLPKEQWIITQGTHEALVSEEEFEMVQIPKMKPLKMPERKIYLLSGLVKCGGCGHMLRRHNRKSPTYDCYYKQYYEKGSCPSKSVRESVIENVITVALEKLFTIFAKEEAKRRKRADKQNEMAIKLIKENQLLERQIGGLQNDKLAAYNRFSDGEVNKDDYLRLRDETDARLKTLIKQSEVLSRKISERREAATKNEFHAAMDGLTFSGTLTREIAEALIEKVLIHDGGRIEIVWKFADELDTVSMSDKMAQ